MLNFFKSNNLAVVSVNVLLIVLYRLLYFFHPIPIANIYHHAEPASKFFIRILHLGPLSSYVWLLIGGGIFCLIDSLLIDKIINSHRVTTRKNYLGGVMFVVFTSLVPECLILSPALVASLILLLCIDKIFLLAKPEKLYSDIFDLGWLSGIAMLFYFPAIYFLLFVSIGFFMVRSVTFRERVMILTGFFCVVAVVFTVYFWFDSLPEMVLDLVNVQYRVPLSLSKFTTWQIAALIWIGIIAIYVVFNVPRLLFSTVIQTRKYVSLLVIGGVLSLLAVPLVFNFDLSHLVFLLVSVSILYAFYFVETKSNLFNEILFIVLILSTVIFECLPLLY
jgi:hypothetical protein